MNLKEWFKRWIRKSFCRNELPEGQLLVLWRDVDRKVYGWHALAHNEQAVLENVGWCIRDAKLEKLEEITGIKIGEGHLPPVVLDDGMPPPDDYM